MMDASWLASHKGDYVHDIDMPTGRWPSLLLMLSQLVLHSTQPAEKALIHYPAMVTMPLGIVAWDKYAAVHVRQSLLLAMPTICSSAWQCLGYVNGRRVLQCSGGSWHLSIS